jgi:hypothetical protein
MSSVGNNSKRSGSWSSGKTNSDSVSPKLANKLSALPTDLQLLTMSFIPMSRLSSIPKSITDVIESRYRKPDMEIVKLSDGSVETLYRGKLHSFDDKPARDYAPGKPGRKEWWKDGVMHRDNAPALIDDGKSELAPSEHVVEAWCRRGRLHRGGDNPAVIMSDGTQKWFVNGTKHRSGDKPAVVGANGYLEWAIKGKTHRSGDQPAIIDNGTYKWYSHGIIHRENDMPAIIKMKNTEEDEKFSNGVCCLQWYKHGNLHRDNDKPALIDTVEREMGWYVNGNPSRVNNMFAKIQLYKNRIVLEWFKRGEYHRTDGPAYISTNKAVTSGSILWHINDSLSREDGPAVITNDEMRWCIDDVDQPEPAGMTDERKAAIRKAEFQAIRPMCQKIFRSFNSMVKLYSPPELFNNLTEKFSQSQ